MTGKQRFLAVLHGQPADCTPVMLHGFMTAVREMGSTMAQYRDSARVMAEAQVRFADRYGLDGIFLDVDTCLEVSALGVPVDYPEDEPARVCGNCYNSYQEIARHADIRALENGPRVQRYLESVRQMREMAGKSLLLRINADQGPFSLAMLLCGMENFMMDLADEDMEEDVCMLIDRCCAVHTRFHRLCKEAGADITSFGDSSCGPDLISPAYYRKFAMPWHRRMKAELQEAGIETICHICGDTSRILPELAQVGFPAYELDYKTDMELAAQTLSGISAVSGPIDPSGVMRFGSPELVREKVLEIRRIFSGRRLLLCSGCALPPDTPPDNIRAFVAAAREIMA